MRRVGSNRYSKGIPVRQCELVPIDGGRFACKHCSKPSLRNQKARRVCGLDKAPLVVPANLPAEEQAAAAAALAELEATPKLRRKIRHWFDALATWAAAGCPTRSMEEAAACRAVCLECPSKKYDADSDSCTVCGCTVSVSRVPLKSKPRMATEDCPKGHWPSVDHAEQPAATDDARAEHQGEHDSHPDSGLDAGD